MIYLEAKKKIKCRSCKGSGYKIVEGYEYICIECKGLKHELSNVLIDIETLAEKIGDTICKKDLKSKNLRK